MLSFSLVWVSSATSPAGVLMLTLSQASLFPSGTTASMGSQVLKSQLIGKDPRLDVLWSYNEKGLDDSLSSEEP